MSCFNPYSARVRSSRADNIDEGSLNGQPSNRLNLLPAAQAIEIATDGRPEMSGHAKDPLLDDFDRKLLAQSQKKRKGMSSTTSLPTVENSEPQDNSRDYAIDPVLQKRYPGSSTSASCDAAPFSSPTVAFKHNRQQLLARKNNQNVRNAFHGRLEQVRQEDVSNVGESKQTTKLPALNTTKVEGPLIRGIKMVPTTNLPDKQRSIFKFSIFNAVQSRCFPTAYESDNNLVVSAPTGSGKTAIMELGILRMIESLKDGRAKVVYQAPTKSLCSERYRDWQTKFAAFDIQCAELTGDTELSHLKNVANASIIITTPEKWDSVTRKWKDNAKLMNMIKLFLVDEVHILKDTRGATLEAIVSRMKAVGNSIRFIALSATIPNSEDIATWLTKNEQARDLPAVREVFDDSYRPVKLKKHILGHEGPYNPWAFDTALTDKIPDVVSRYGKRKPVMVFCPTKESAHKTANRLAQSWLDSTGGIRAWDAPRSISKVENETLQKVLPAAVAFHHASLSPEDRRAVEQGFLNRDVNIICCTSTLAVGVNLPCYLVILKGTQGYANAGLQEYSSLEIMQMLGRAGRPQFEREACAVILCLNDRLSKYEKMVAGEEVLESSLHQNLVEHLNAEVGLGTVDSMASAKKWLSSTFLHVRLQKNPKYYNLDPGSLHLTPDEALLQWCERDIKLLAKAGLVEDNGTLRPTEYGDIMARYCIRFATMEIFMAVPPQAKFSVVLDALCQAVEFREIRMRQGDKAFYKELNKANDIRFPIEVDVALPQHKVSLIIQAKLGCVQIPKDPRNKAQGGQLRQLSLDTNSVINYAKRLIRCMVDVFVQRNDSFAVKSALELARGLAAGIWDNTVLQLKQVPGIGDVFTRKLASAGVKDVDTLSNTEPHRIEVILSKNPPFGLELIKKIADFPMLHISVRECGQKHQPGKGVDIKLRCEVGFLNEHIPFKFNRRSYNILFLCETSYGDIVEFRRFGPTRLKTVEEILLTSTVNQSGAKLRCHIMCDDIVGTHRYAEIDIKCPVSWFPPQPPTPEVSFQRPRVRPETPAKPVLEEFDNEGVDDSDLLAAVYKSINEQVVEDIDDIIEEDDKEKHRRKRRLTVSSGEEMESFREPQKLANGKWNCQHTCKDEGKECKHKCCLEGVKKKPKNKKQKKEKDAVPTDATHRSKSGKKVTKKQSSHQGPLDKMLRRPDNDNVTEPVAQKSMKRPAAASDPSANQTKVQRDASVPSRTSTKPQVPQSCPDPDPERISDAFDVGDFDWQAMDEIAAAFDFDPTADEAATGKSGQGEYKTSDEVRGRQLAGLDLSKPIVFDQSSDPSGLFLAHTSSPYKQPPSRYDSYDTDLLADSGVDFLSHDHGSPTKSSGTNSMNSITQRRIEGSSGSGTANIQSPCATQADIADPASGTEETEYERAQRLEEEIQKRRWAELGSDKLTYETFGKYIRIVDD